MTVAASRVGDLLGTEVEDTRPVGGGSICDASRVTAADGRAFFVKTLRHGPADLFAVEASGLGGLDDAGGCPLPRVEAVAEDVLVLEWVEPGAPSPEAAERFGRELARTHQAGAPMFGWARDGYIGPLPLPNAPAVDWPDFYASRRVLPYLRQAVDAGVLAADEVGPVETVCGQLLEIAGPTEQPARVHGDLWSGNVLWSSEGPAYLVDPACHGGHRETDLAMLALFGLPYLDRVLAAYDEAYPLADGWRARVPLHQLHPLLVHTVLFGGGYAGQAVHAAREALAAA
ncbi:MAG: fructosamine kinase family protein [Actinomycetes bacterium]